MRKRAILSVSIVSVILMGLMTACGNETGTNSNDVSKETRIIVTFLTDIRCDIITMW